MNIELSNDQAIFLGELLERERMGWVRWYSSPRLLNADDPAASLAMGRHYEAMISGLLVQLVGDDLELEEVGK
jgi:hypothetical protein